MPRGSKTYEIRVTGGATHEITGDKLRSTSDGKLVVYARTGEGDTQEPIAEFAKDEWVAWKEMQT